MIKVLLFLGFKVFKKVVTVPSHQVEQYRQTQGQFMLEMMGEEKLFLLFFHFILICPHTFAQRVPLGTVLGFNLCSLTLCFESLRF
jgi:hypothetical protein